MKKELYKLLYEWFVSEYECDHCEHIKTFIDGDGKHPCNQCTNHDRFKVSDDIVCDLKEKVKMIVEITKKK